MKALTSICVSCLILLLATALTVAAQSQQRFTEGEFAGFTKSSTEHIVVRLDQPITVRSARGRIVSKADGTELADAIFEVRVPVTGRVVGCKTDEHGRFKLPRLQPGTYVFKATKDGFQSVVGTLVVGKAAKRDASISIGMELGV